MDSALLVPVLFIFGCFVSSFLVSGNSRVPFVGGSVSLLVFASVCLSVSGKWSVVGGCVDEIGILCAWVCELVLFRFSVFGHWFAMCPSCWQIKHVFFSVVNILYVLFSIITVKELGMHFAFSGSMYTCLLKLNMWDKSGSVIPLFRGVMLDNNLMLFLLNVFSIWLCGIIGETLIV